LVLSDLLMPELDGAELIAKIKELSPETPAILFSGKVKIYERDTRADVFLPKGMYAPIELLERIRLLLVKKRGPKRALPPITMPEPVRVGVRIGAAYPYRTGIPRPKLAAAKKISRRFLLMGSLRPRISPGPPRHVKSSIRPDSMPSIIQAENVTKIYH